MHLQKWNWIVAMLKWVWDIARGFVIPLHGYQHHLFCSVYHLWRRFCTVLLFLKQCHIENESGFHGSIAFVKVSSGWRITEAEGRQGGGKVIFILPPPITSLCSCVPHAQTFWESCCMCICTILCMCACVYTVFVWKIDGGLSTCQAASGQAHTEQVGGGGRCHR